MMLAAKLRASTPTAGGLDTQTVTTGASGTAPEQDRIRGYISGSLGSITDGVSDIYSTAISSMGWNENGGLGAFYFLTIAGASDSGWTSMTIGGTKTLLRADATYDPSGQWTWASSEFPGTQAFGAAGAVKTVAFN